MAFKFLLDEDILRNKNYMLSFFSSTPHTLGGPGSTGCAVIHKIVLALWQIGNQELKGRYKGMKGCKNGGGGLVTGHQGPQFRRLWSLKNG